MLLSLALHHIKEYNTMNVLYKNSGNWCCFATAAILVTDKQLYQQVATIIHTRSIKVCWRFGS
jgi:hypothetical protein